MYYIGGLLKHAKAITRVANPTINSYKRLVPGYEAPCYLAWSAANRSALVRVPAARGNSTRAEFRSPDPMCNPYLTFACMLAAGMDGIKNKIMPPESTNTNIYHLNAKDRKRLHVEMLPASLAEANAALLKDEVICNTLGEHVVDEPHPHCRDGNRCLPARGPPVGTGQVPGNLLNFLKIFQNNR